MLYCGENRKRSAIKRYFSTIRNTLKMNIFTEHLIQVSETYLQHMKKALTFSFKLLYMSFQVFIHAFLPFLYVTTVSEKIEVMNTILQKRKDKS